jgi:hypothetical protein
MQSAMLAAMKNVWLASALGEQSRAERMLAEREARPAADNPDYRVALRVLRLRIAARDADDAEMAQLVREIGHQPGMAPALIWSPAFKENSIADANAAARRRGEPDPIRIASSDIAAVQWIDVGFWIRPDGRTAAVEILRGSRTQGWAPSVVRQIEGRRYTADASATTGLGEGSYRVERVSKRAEYFTPIGSLIRRRVGASGFEILDLTDATG